MIRCRFVLFAIVLMAIPVVGKSDDSTRVDVFLLGETKPTRSIVAISDIARVSGGDLITRRKISSLDIARFPRGSSTAHKVTMRQVRVRILLAGIEPHEFHLGGAHEVRLQAGKQPRRTNIVEFLKPDIARALGANLNDVNLRLTRPLPDALSGAFDPHARLEHFLPSSIRVGPLNVRIGIYEGDRLIRSTSVAIDIQLTREVLVAGRYLEVGHIVTEADVVRERRTLSGQLANYAASSVVGKKVRKAIRAGSVLTDLALLTTTVPKRDIVIRSRDVVEIVARRKALQVKVSGAIALQQGAIGEAIRVKNPNSGKVMTARVVDSGVVEIQL